MSEFGLNDVLALEGEADPSEEELACSLQRAINSGSAWSFQGSYGRSMMDAIESGVCMLGLNAARDYWGNRIPNRSEVQEGTKGSRGFVVERSGEEWAVMLEGV